MAIQAKPHTVYIGTDKVHVMGRTKQGAIRDAVKHYISTHDIRCELMTGDELYAAGQGGVQIIGHDKYERVVDPNQLPLTGVSESVEQ